MTPIFGGLVARAFAGGTDVSLRELCEAMDLPSEDTLGSALRAVQIVVAMGLYLHPEINKGDFDMRRSMRQALVGAGEAQIRALLLEGETAQIEYKSTLCCDMAALLEKPARLAKSDGVIHSALKTICAFANTSGGQLLLGVTDHPKICGIESDFGLLKGGKDEWENEFRNLIGGRFYRGRLLNSFVSFQFCPTAEGTVALTTVVPRSASTFLKHPKDNRYEFFVRQGNRSVALDMYEFEEFIQGRS